MIEGYDVSQWQANTPTDGASFLIARACYGTWVDSMYATHERRARAAGLAVGAYCFGRHGDVGGQVDTLLRVAPNADFYALDLESDGANPPMTHEEAAAFIRGMHARGKRCGLYASESGYPELGQDWRWVANWAYQPSIDWQFWQHTGGPLDRDRFAGTKEDLDTFIGRQKMTEQPITPAPAPYVPPTAGKTPGWYELSTLWKAVLYLAEALGYDITPTPGWVIPAASVYVTKVAPKTPQNAPEAPTEAAPDVQAAPATSEATEASLPPETREVEVAEGDTLYSIAQRELGSGARWPDIVNANGLDPLEPLPPRLRVPKAV